MMTRMGRDEQCDTEMYEQLIEMKASEGEEQGYRGWSRWGGQVFPRLIRQQQHPPAVDATT